MLSEEGNLTTMPPGLCRWRMGGFSPDNFNLNSCSWCYYFLFPTKGLFPFGIQYLQVMLNGSVYPKGTMLLADVNNVTAREQVCSTLNDDECEMWKLCCDAARDCCRRQIRDYTDDVINVSCRSTWDGFACWEDGKPGTNSYQSCPTFLQFSVPTSEQNFSISIDL